MALMMLFIAQVSAQGISNEAEWNGFGYSLKKVTSNTSIQSGINFSYTILFSAPAGSGTITIEDQVPASLNIVSVPTPSPVCGVTPTVSISGNTVTYTLTGLPSGCAPSGSFNIVVQFPPGTTCNGTSARNRAGILVTDKWYYTPYVSTTAQAVDPWKISKSIVSGAVVNPSGGSCGYLMPLDGTVTYKVTVMKQNIYWGNNIGQHNMSSAVVTDVLPAGAVLLSSTCGATQSGSTISWPIGTLNAANPYAYYSCQFTIHYPAGTFPNGSTIYNSADLDGVICNAPSSHSSNQTCIEVGEIVANPNGFFQKYLSLTNRVPGCQGYYRITMCNNGNVPLSAFNITDNIPSGITVNHINVYGGNATTTMNLEINSSPFASGISSSYYTTGPITSTVSNIELQMTGSLPVGNCIYVYIYFTIDPNPTGTVITNCAQWNGLANGLTLPQSCISFTVLAGEPKPCLIKDICSTASEYEPGDIVRFRLRVQNIGSEDLMSAMIQDVLHSNFTYVGNESYYIANTYNPPCSSGGLIPTGASTWSGVTTNHSGSNLEWVLPDIPADCQLFYTAYCGNYGTSALPYYYIEFDAQVTNTALPGVTPNSYIINGGNLSGSVSSNTVNVLIVASFGQEVEKLVSTDNGNSFNASGTTTAGSTITYKLDYKNTSNVPVTSVNIVDLLPLDDSPNDWLILNRTAPRGSDFGVTYAANHSTTLLPSGVPPTPALTYAPGNNICLPSLGISSGCNSTLWSSTPNQNIRLSYGTFALTPAYSIQENFDVTLDANAQVGKKVCNDFAAIATADFLLNGSPQSVALTPVAAPQVCVTIEEPQATCCDSIRLTQVDGDGCCVRLETRCEVKSVNVSINNGTLSNISWNCGALPTGYIGLNQYQLGANNCAIDMTTCVDATLTGAVTITFDIIFANGEHCKKEISIDCTTDPVNCCESLIVERIQGDGCCARIVSSCPVESVKVIVDNGVLTSTSWNCGPLPTGYINQNSYTFTPGGCILDMTNCIEATYPGGTTITYSVQFLDGTKCEKVIKLPCEPSADCCALVDFKLKPKWPFFNTLIGSFNITNLDPGSPICQVLINSIPATTFTTGNLIIDGIPSTQPWTSNMIPSIGSLSPSAVNTINFTLLNTKYKGAIEICVIKCDGTKCCFDFKWNKKPIIDIGIGHDEIEIKGKLHAITISPYVNSELDTKIKYIAFGLSDKAEAETNAISLFAASSATYQGDDEVSGQPMATSSYMGKYNLFFELTQPVEATKPIGEFNMVFLNGIPNLGCTLFDTQGDIIYHGLLKKTSVGTSEIEARSETTDIFEIVAISPNPNNGIFELKYVIGKERTIEASLINSIGQIVYSNNFSVQEPGLHTQLISTIGLTTGVYLLQLSSGNRSVSTQIIIQ